MVMIGVLRLIATVTVFVTVYIIQYAVCTPCQKFHVFHFPSFTGVPQTTVSTEGYVCYFYWCQTLVCDN